MRRVWRARWTSTTKDIAQGGAPLLVDRARTAGLGWAGHAQVPSRVVRQPTGCRKGQVIGTWYLRDRWGDPQRHSDRMYYRIVTADHEVFELYHDIASGMWVLDVVQDWSRTNAGSLARVC